MISEQSKGPIGGPGSPEMNTMKESEAVPLSLDTLMVYLPPISLLISLIKIIRNSSKTVIFKLLLSLTLTSFLNNSTSNGKSPDHLILILVLSPSDRCRSEGICSILGGAPTLTLPVVRA